MSALGAAAIGGGVNIANNLLDLWRAKKGRIFQREMADKAYAHDVEMWQRANEYNTPAAQMARLKKAGLNPNLVYGSGSAAGNTATQTPKYQRYDTPVADLQVQPSAVLNILGAYQDYKIKRVQESNLKEQLRGKKIENLYKHDLMSGKAKQSYGLGTKIMYELGQLDVPSSDKRSTKEKIRTSPFGRKYQAEIAGKEHDALLKAFYSKLSKRGLTKNDSMLLRLLMTNDGQVDSKMLPYLLLDAVGRKSGFSK